MTTKRVFGTMVALFAVPVFGLAAERDQEELGKKLERLEALIERQSEKLAELEKSIRC